MKRGSKGSVTNGKSCSNVGSLFVKKSYLNGSLKAKREIVKGKDIKSKTEIHYLNPRNQEALTLEAVTDIYSSIQENGVSTEGVAIEKDGKYHVLDASRRRFCCIESDQDLPLWVIEGEPTDAQLLKLINDSQEVKKWSYPEHAQYLLRIAERKQLDVETMKIDDLANELSIGRESLRKRLAANKVSKDILKIFVDYEGIPNNYYSVLAKIQNQLSKAGKDIGDSMKSFIETMEDFEPGESILAKQASTLKKLEEFVDRLLMKQSKPEWSNRQLCQFEDKKAYARAKTSPDGKTMKIELSRVGAEKMREIERLVQQILNS